MHTTAGDEEHNFDTSPLVPTTNLIQGLTTTNNHRNVITFDDDEDYPIEE
jgi:hypothetical protein